MIIYLQMIESDEDKSKFEQLYIMYKGLMFHVAMKILKNEFDAEDAVHQAFLSLIENLKKISDVKCPKTRASIPCSQSAGRGIFISSSLESTDLLDIATAASWLRPYLCVVQMCNCFLSSDEGRNSLSISNQALNRYWSTVIISLGLHIHNEACDAFAFKLRIALCAKSIAYFLFIINVIVFHSQGKLMILKVKNPALKGKINQYA